MDGKDVIAELRTWSKVPIVVLSARDREAEKIAALDLGADDYVNKPFGIGAHPQKHRPPPEAPPRPPHRQAPPTPDPRRPPPPHLARRGGSQGTNRAVGQSGAPCTMGIETGRRGCGTARLSIAA